MAIFETGAITTVPNLLDALASFCVTNGWTSNFNAVEGSGRRVHLQLDSDVFMNFRASVAENINNGTSNIVAGSNSLLVVGSTSYNGANSWLMQPGKPYIAGGGSGDLPRMVGMIGISGAMPAYYFFARGDMIYVFIEYATGQYQWLMFGRVTKTCTWSGGAFYAAANSAYSGNVPASLSAIAGYSNTTQTTNMGLNPNAYMYGSSIDGNTGWLPASNETVVPIMPKFFETISMLCNSVANMSNLFNQQPVLSPVEICITRDGTGNRDNNTNFSVVGKLPDIYFCNIRNLTPAQQMDDGSGDTFRVFPFKTKTNVANSPTFWWGVAIKEN